MNLSNAACISERHEINTGRVLTLSQCPLLRSHQPLVSFAEVRFSTDPTFVTRTQVLHKLLMALHESVRFHQNCMVLQGC